MTRGRPRAPGIAAEARATRRNGLGAGIGDLVLDVKDRHVVAVMKVED